MSQMKLPQISAFANLPKSLSFDKRPDAAQRWSPDIKTNSDNADNVITMYDEIGESWYSEGVTAKRVADALRRIGDKEVVVNLNSPGGDYFEGISIYNILAQHPAKVTVQVVGLAASAASVIAMAGDEILMGDGSFLMIHNAWSLAIGNRHDLQGSIDILAQIDEAMANLYAARSGLSKAEVVGMMDRESYINQASAINNGLATGAMDKKSVETAEDGDRKKAKALIDTALAQSGYTRSQRREVFQNLFSSSMPCAADTAVTPSADSELVSGLLDLKNLFN